MYVCIMYILCDLCLYTDISLSVNFVHNTFKNAKPQRKTRKNKSFATFETVQDQLNLCEVNRLLTWVFIWFLGF